MNPRVIITVLWLAALAARGAVFVASDPLTSVVSDDFDRLRVKWLQSLTGGTNYSLADSLVQSSLASLTNSARSYWTSMNTNAATNRPYLWADLTRTDVSGQISVGYGRLRCMALAYAAYGSAVRTNAMLAAAIQGGLNWMYTNRYNERASAYDNWFDWEIGTPLEPLD